MLYEGGGGECEFNISLARRWKSHFELWQMEQRFQDSTGRPKILPKNLGSKTKERFL